MLALASDERLATEIRNGNETAFEVLYERHRRALLSLCRHMLGSQHEAEEALQHSFAAAWSDLQHNRRPLPARLRPWLFAITRNRCLSLLRARRPDATQLDELPSTAGLSDEVARRADLRGLLGDLRDLPEEQRAALLLSEIGGLTHSDIADVLGRDEADVKGLVFRARSTLIDWREAREAPCEQFRDQLSVLRGGALRRKALRRHLRDCPGCRAFRRELRVQRGMIALILPVAPSAGLKGSVVAASFGGAGASGGAASSSAAVGLGTAMLAPLGASAVATVAVVGVLTGGALTGGNDPAQAQPASLTRPVVAWLAKQPLSPSGRTRLAPTGSRHPPVPGLARPDESQARRGGESGGGRPAQPAPVAGPQQTAAVTDTDGSAVAKAPEDKIDETAKAPDGNKNEAAKAPDDKKDKAAKAPDDHKDETAKAPDGNKDEAVRAPDDKKDKAAKAPEKDAPAAATRIPKAEREEADKVAKNDPKVAVKAPKPDQKQPTRSPRTTTTPPGRDPRRASRGQGSPPPGDPPRAAQPPP